MLRWETGGKEVPSSSQPQYRHVSKVTKKNPINNDFIKATPIKREERLMKLEWDELDESSALIGFICLISAKKLKQYIYK